MRWARDSLSPLIRPKAHSSCKNAIRRPPTLPPAAKVAHWEASYRGRGFRTLLGELGGSMARFQLLLAIATMTVTNVTIMTFTFC